MVDCSRSDMGARLQRQPGVRSVWGIKFLEDMDPLGYRFRTPEQPRTPPGNFNGAPVRPEEV